MYGGSPSGGASTNFDDLSHNNVAYADDTVVGGLPCQGHVVNVTCPFCELYVMVKS